MEAVLFLASPTLPGAKARVGKFAMNLVKASDEKQKLRLITCFWMFEDGHIRGIDER